MLRHSTALQPATALQYGMFVKAAYDVYDADINNLNPTQADYPDFPSGYKLLLNVQMTDFFGNSNYPKYYGFYAISESAPFEVVLALRGTQAWQEWWDDFDWELDQSPYLAGNVADGFLTIYQTFSVTIPGQSSQPTLLKDKINLPDGTSLASTPPVVVGHSLGGALATLYAADVSSVNINPTVYTLASPRVGDTAFATAYDQAISTNYRIYNWPDLVPSFPKDPFDNYQHVKGGYEVDSLDYPLEVQMTVDCFHSLLTYLFLLGAPDSILGGFEGCGY